MSRDDRPLAEDSALFGTLDDEPGPATPLSRAESDAVAWSVVGRFAATLPGVEPADAAPGPATPLDPLQAERLARSVTSKHRRRLAPLQNAAVVLLALTFGGVAFAALRTFVVERAAQRAAETTVARSPSRAKPKTRKAEQEAAREPDLANDLDAPSVPAVVAPEAPSEPVVQPSGAELLARANALRAKTQWRAAQTLYLRVLGAEATNRERCVAMLAAASLAVEHTGTPRQGLALYRRALTLDASGELAEEARVGMARASRALGDGETEAAALRELLARHPKSVWAPQAKRRLEELAALRR